MITLTDAARKWLAVALTRASDDGDAVFRLAEGGEGFDLFLHQREPGDVEFAAGDRTLLVIDEKLAARLDGRTIDVRCGVPDSPADARPGGGVMLSGVS